MLRENGLFSRSGDSNVLDLQFCATLDEFLLNHEIQTIFKLNVVKYRLPRLIYSRRNYDTFSKLMRNYSIKCMAVIWGVIDQEGNIKHFEITFRENTFRDQKKVDKFFSDLKRIIEFRTLNGIYIIKFFANAISAILGNSFCDFLIDNNQWQKSLWLAINSHQFFERGIKVLEDSKIETISSIIEFERKRFLPLFIRQEAISLCAGEQFEDALNRLHEALMIEPFWPLYDLQEFMVFYNNRYAWEVSDYQNLGYLKEAKPSYKELGMVDLPPNLQLFLDYLRIIPINLNELEKKIDNWFLELEKKYQDNPFILIYWADALKVPFFLQHKQEISEMRIKGEIYILPLEILDQAILKLKKAYDIAPNMPVIASRLSALYAQSLTYYSPGSVEFSDALNMMGYYLNLARRYLQENIPGGVATKN